MVSGGGMIVVFLVGSGGFIMLFLLEGENVFFCYGGVGGGIGLGMCLLCFGKVNFNVKGKSVGGVGVLEVLLSIGIVLVVDGLVGCDLFCGDFIGFCMYVEFGVGVIVGGLGMVIFFGFDFKLLVVVVLVSVLLLIVVLGVSMLW